ncbi:sarcosine oxidase subunit gamma [Azospirillum sp.]|uniref:sarcosine oxidase subunit gamma n=1 Tax=Azospirillum sp. TaxID=34012 RepID=UPI003D754272
MADTVHLMPPAGRIALRGRPSDRAFVDAVVSVLGVAPPEPNVAVLGAVSLYWLQPTSWLVECAPGDTEALTARLCEAVRDRGMAVDVSDTRVTFRLSGPDAVTLLNKGCSLDLHPRVFPVGRSALCAFAQLHALLVKTSDAPVFQLTIPRGAQRHFEDWLAAAF